MRYGDALSFARQPAAAACRPARSPGDRSASTAARTIGWTKRNGRPSSRIPAAASSSAAVTAMRESTPARPAASRRSTSPSTAAARASWRAHSGRRLSRCTTECETARGARPAMRADAADVGSMRSSAIARTSSRMRNGTPPVTWWQVAAKTGSTSVPSASRTRTATPRWLSGASSRTSVDGSAANAASSGEPSTERAGRVAATIAIGSSWSRRPR